MIFGMVALIRRGVMSRLYCCVLASLCLFALPTLPNNALATESIHNISFKRINPANYSADQNTVGAVGVITQDRHGFLWIGGINGLARFDGYEFKIYNHIAGDNTSIAGDNIQALVIDNEGVMWVGTPGGLSRFDEEYDTFTNFYASAGTALSGKSDSLISSDLTSIAVAADNSLVIGTSLGMSIFNPERTTFTNYQHDPNNENSLNSNDIDKIIIDRLGIIWVGTQTDLNSFNRLTNQFKRYVHDKDDPNSLSDSAINSLYEDSKGQLWIGYFEGLVDRLDANRTTFTHIESPHLSKVSNVIMGISETSDNKVWISADHAGALVYDLDTGEQHLFTHDKSDPSTLDSNQTRYVFEDAKKNIWIGSFSGVLNHFSRQRAIFKNYKASSDGRRGLIHKAVISLFESSDKSIWVGTEGGLNRFEPKTSEFKQYKYDESQPSKSVKEVPVLAIDEATDGTILLATWADGLIELNPDNDSTVQYQPDPNDPNAVSDKYLWAVHVDDEGRNWIGTETGGMELWDREKKIFRHFAHDSDNDNTVGWRLVNDIVSTADDHLWIATMKGVSKYSKANDTFQQYRPQDTIKNPLASRVFVLHKRENGDLWAGTEGGGLLVLKKGADKFEVIGRDEGLPNLTISGITEDDDGYIWVGTLNGLIRIDPNNISKMKVLKKHHGLISHFMNRNSLIYSSDKLLYVGTNEGLSVFDPKMLDSGTEQDRLLITDIRVHSKPVEIGSSILKVAPHLATNIELPYYDNAIAIKFSLVQFQSSNLNNLVYRLKGLEENWMQSDISRTASYTNLDPGKYIFEVKAADQLTEDDAPTTQIRITIHPPAWKTWWAYTLYVILFIAAIFIFIRQQNRKIKQEKVYQEALNVKLVKLDKLKSDFLANTSHELRTPLNGIIGIAESLEYALRNVDGDLQEQAGMIIASGRRLSSMINSVLDFSNISENKLELSLRPENLYLAAESAIHIMEPQAISKGLSVINKIQNTGTMVLGDRERLQHIFLNLISNAIKYSRQGTIIISTDIQDHVAQVSITDQGVGIPDDAKAHLFSAFSQLEHSDTRSNEGSGLGLALTKKLVELHGGIIDVESVVNEGTSVKFTLKLATRESIKAALYKKPIVTQEEASPPPVEVPIEKESVPPVEPPPPEKLELTPPSFAPQTNILIVDDDSINRMVLKGILKVHKYPVVEADSGQKALDILASGKKIDLVILDIMMPEMSGFEVCEAIRKTYDKQELPIVFLTAKTTNEARKEGLELGGNDFLTKPTSKAKMLPAIVDVLEKAKQ